MGQKVNPIGLRLGINRTSDSRWYADSADYGRLVHEDLKIRKTIKDELKQAEGDPILKSRMRSLARDLHTELGGPGVGALGMCFTGGFALAMMVDDAVAAPVLCQPSVPFAVGRRRAADLNLSPDDLAAVKQRAAGGCTVLGIQYASDPMTGSRFDTLDRELGDAFLRVDLPGKGHSVVTEQRSQVAVDRVLAFFEERLR